MSRLFIVSNRLPLTVEQKDGTHLYRQSSGGLISAIKAFLGKDKENVFSETVWVGVPGCSEHVWNAAVQSNNHEDFTYLPIFLNWKKYELYYNGFSNSVLWPLFHYFPSFAEYNTQYYQAYIESNSVFAESMAEQLNPDDNVWIHDYHLLPLAGMLRKKFPTLTIGFFLHIPFPSFEIFRMIPKEWQRGLLEGMLGADLIGFHTLEYTGHFLACIETILLLEHDGQYISWDNRQVKADAFPISIDFSLFNEAYDTPEVVSARLRYEKIKGDKKLIFSVDRLDYTKGISNRLKGYEQFLLDNPEYAEKVTFALNIVPSRDSIVKYAERKKIIDEYIGSFNSRLGSIGWQPVLYQYKHLSFHELIALYTACDLALITPLRDGMNLVAKEFVASRSDKRGVLVLSEMAGAAKELSEGLLINPNDTNEIAAMIKYGLEMDITEQEERMQAMQGRICRYDVLAWASDFFEQLKNVKSVQLEFEVKFIDTATKVNLLRDYSRAERRLFLLDYDGSLMPFSKFPNLAVPTPDLLSVLRKMAEDPCNEIYIISGRDSNILEKWFDLLPIGLVAEHGAKIRPVNGNWRTEVVSDTRRWISDIEQIMEAYVTKCPQSFIERKDFSLAWHYRNADLLQGSVRAKELYHELQAATADLPLHVLNGHKVIEVRNAAINKGVAAGKLIKRRNPDFIFAIGDDETDEDMFKKLARLSHSYSIKIGNDASFAKYNLHSPHEVQNLLRMISEAQKIEIQ
ncbi:MAG: bifunctional alpha,alpha-trehalose-phosphate synthase (UDP-forming)/trehalose-phosphatase [Flavipsychrobacter sp.]|jgi:trehalose 6-phosphate synthase/phosphatase|nr:bifunctional alpha,alpha-trehalose-phosphate synthase (UDP-forming)/trehalose-phosphatase [Flavipsychrobacter sp.]